ncbi:MAG: hypothetical protein Q9200_004611 [Gallowayella weberi]
MQGELSKEAKQEQRVGGFQEAEDCGSAYASSMGMGFIRADQEEGTSHKDFGHPLEDEVQEGVEQRRATLRARVYNKKKAAREMAARINANTQSSSSSSNEQSSHDCRSAGTSSQGQRDTGSDTAGGGGAQSTSQPDEIPTAQ